MKRFSAIVAGMFLLCTTIYAFEQKEINVRSEKMNRDIPITVITPESYDTTKTFPVIYLLHGFSDNNTRWASTGVIGPLADQYDIIFVMPDGGYDSWYFDSPICPEYQYETFVSSELVEYIDNNYQTINNRAGRAITGLSMGGHGAMYLGIRHQDVFGSIGSMSGGVDFRPFPNNWGISKRLGSFDTHPENWEKNTVINMTHLLKPGSMNIIFDCGTDDFFYGVNCALHEKLLSEKIPHDFYSRPGGHTWTYWKNSIKYHTLFFNDRFTR